MKTNLSKANNHFCQNVGQVSVPIYLAAFILTNKSQNQTVSQYIQYLVNLYMTSDKNLEYLKKHQIKKHQSHLNKYISFHINDIASPMHTNSLDKFFLTTEDLTLPNWFVNSIENEENLDTYVNAILFYYEERKNLLSEILKGA